jgi:hypothetical protein
MVEYVVLHALYHLRQMDRLCPDSSAIEALGSPLASAKSRAGGDRRHHGHWRMGLAAAAGLRAVGFNVIRLEPQRQGGCGVAMSTMGATGWRISCRTDILVNAAALDAGTRGLIDRGLRGSCAGPARSAARPSSTPGAAMRSTMPMLRAGLGRLRAASLDVFTGTSPCRRTAPIGACPM